MGKNNGYYGGLAGLAVAVTLQPLDNVKMALIVPPQKLKLSSNFIKNFYLASQFILIEEGWKAFYKGLVVNAAKTGIGSAVYFYLLRLIERNVHENVEGNVSNFVASAIARVAGSIVINPLSIIETRYEIHGTEKWEGNILGNLKRIYQIEGLEGFFKGCAASCWKEASFAGLYYSLYRIGKDFGISSFFSGIGSGMISTFITHPFEIVRTNIQVRINFHKDDPHHKQKSIVKQLVELSKKGHLFDGVTPRLVKKPLANTISFLLFEYMEERSIGKNLVA